MTQSIKFCSVLEPEIEKRLYSPAANEDVLFSFFTELAVNLDSVRDHLLVIIPFELKGLFLTTRLKTALSVLTSKGSQSKILFMGLKKSEDCKVSCADEMFGVELGSCTTKLIINLMRESNFPIVLGLENRQLVKADCSICFNIYHCGFAHKFSVKQLPLAMEHLRNLIKEFETLMQSGEGILLKCSEVNIIKSISKFLAFMHSVEPDKLKYIDDIQCINSFFDDIKDVPYEVLKDISFSMFRALAYEKTDNRASMESLSIDWHANNPKVMNGFKIHRCDVAKPHERGTFKSGTKRIFIAEKDNKKVFIGYTDEHDISAAVLKSRLS